MKEICFATNNKNKLKEIRTILGDQIKVLSLEDINCFEELPENQTTIEGNSIEKAQYVYENYQIPCFADDTGLEVKALQGAPGVYSARYAGPDCSAEDNMVKLLHTLENEKDRSARFKTVITLISGTTQESFEGVVNGHILEEKSGNEGFGYDPVFQPKGYEISFAEMDMAEKNKISHRGLATQKLVEFLKNVETA